MPSEDEFENLKRRDVRVRALDTALLVDQELQESKTLQLVLASIEDDANDALHQFADINPYNAQVVGELQARVHRLVYLKRTIAFIRSSGQAAAEALQSEDVIHEDE